MTEAHNFIGKTTRRVTQRRGCWPHCMRLVSRRQTLPLAMNMKANLAIHKYPALPSLPVAFPTDPSPAHAIMPVEPESINLESQFQMSPLNTPDSPTPAHKNIYIIGAQCTGKTTLVNALASHFQATNPPAAQPFIIKEVARTVLIHHSFTAQDITSSTSRCLALQRLILQAQVRAETAALKSQACWFVSDRSGIDPICYALQYVGQEGADVLLQSSEWVELKERMRGSLVVVCEAGVGWLSDDGVRLMPENVEEWNAFHELFCGLLEREGVSYVVLPRDVGSVAERLRFVLERYSELCRLRK